MCDYRILQDFIIVGHLSTFLLYRWSSVLAGDPFTILPQIPKSVDKYILREAIKGISGSNWKFFWVASSGGERHGAAMCGLYSPQEALLFDGKSRRPSEACQGCVQSLCAQNL